MLDNYVYAKTLYLSTERFINSFYFYIYMMKARNVRSGSFFTIMGSISYHNGWVTTHCIKTETTRRAVTIEVYPRKQCTLIAYKNNKFYKHL